MIFGSVSPLPDFLNQRAYIAHFDLKMAVNAEGDKCIALPFQKRNLGNSMIQALHGGVVALALETAGQLALSEKNPAYRNAQVEIAHTTYLIRTRPQTLWAHAQIVRSGARFVRLEAKAFQEHGEVAHSMLTAVLLGNEME